MNIYETGKNKSISYKSSTPFAGYSPIAQEHPVRKDFDWESLENEYWDVVFDDEEIYEIN